MKKCTKCNVIKNLNKFSILNKSKDGRKSSCRDCRNKSGFEYRTSKEGRLTQIYHSQKIASKHRGHNQPEYTKKELKKWLFSQELFHKLHKNWVDSDFDKMLSPSVDRLDDSKGYSFDNIQIGTWKQNFDNWMKKMPEEQLKPISQYTRNWEFIREFRSRKEAEHITGINGGSITNVCYNKRPTAGGFKWRYNNHI